MPLPKVTPEDKKSKDGFNNYMQKCMHVLKDEKRPQAQKVAMCISTYKTSKKKKEAKGDFSEPLWEDNEINGFIVI